MHDISGGASGFIKSNLSIVPVIRLDVITDVQRGLTGLIEIDVTANLNTLYDGEQVEGVSRARTLEMAVLPHSTFGFSNIHCRIASHSLPTA
jgi:hypothetical protein